MLRILFFIPLVIFAACAPKAAFDHDNAELDRLMNENQTKVEACYKSTKASHPKLSGSLTVAADQNPDGSLSYISLVRGFPGSQPLFDCIRQEITSWKVENPQTRGRLEMTWNFH